MTGGRRWRRCSTSKGRRDPGAGYQTIPHPSVPVKGIAAQPMTIEAPHKSPGRNAGLNTVVHFVRYGLPVFLVMAAIFVVSQMSSAAVNDVPSSGFLTAIFGEFTDEAAHFIEYFVLSGLILRWILAVKVPPGAVRPGFALIGSSARNAVALAVLYGISDEVHQWFIDSRSAELIDLLVDGIGAIIGAAIYLSVYQAWRILMSRGAGRLATRPANESAGLSPDSAETDMQADE